MGQMFSESRTVADLAGPQKDAVPLSNLENMPNLKTAPISDIFIIVVVLQTILVACFSQADAFKNVVRDVEEWPDKTRLKGTNSGFLPSRRPSNDLYGLFDPPLILNTHGFLQTPFLSKLEVTS